MQMLYELNDVQYNEILFFYLNLNFDSKSFL